MFEISWSELLILGIVTLIFVGPKELPVFLRTLGKYAASLRRQANEFKSHFDAAMREAELDTMREEMAAMQARVNAEVMGAKEALSEAASPPMPATPGAGASPKSNSTATAATPVSTPPSAAKPELPMPPMPAPPRMGG